MSSEETKNNSSSNFAFGHSKKVAAESLALMINAFGFVAALAWNDAIQKLIQKLFQSDGTIVSSFVYAGIVTIIAVMLTARLANIKKRLGEL